MPQWSVKHKANTTYKNECQKSKEHFPLSLVCQENNVTANEHTSHVYMAEVNKRINNYRERAASSLTIYNFLKVLRKVESILSVYYCSILNLLSVT